MPSALPPGDPPPSDGSLPPQALERAGTAPFAIYVHVPFCAVRCGYCDFNTYAPGDLGSAVDPTRYADSVLTELDLARRVLPSAASVSSVFIGGGTPTVLPATHLSGILAGIRDRFGLEPDAEVTVEANPDTVSPDVAATLAGGGVTRLSLGMQSAVPHVLATLDRTHDPANVARAVAAARAAGLRVSLDLIYGTPGEHARDWQVSLETALDHEPDHISAYALVVEEGTRMATQVRRGLLPAPLEDDLADKYEQADELLATRGYHWYEVSNWARTPEDACRHNLAYWRTHTWWGIGPGAHSHVGAVRWWNVRHPGEYAARLAQGCSPAAGRETLTEDQRYAEHVLLTVRLAEGLATASLRPAGRAAVAGLIADGLLDRAAALRHDRVVLTRTGRLLADLVVRRLLS